MNKDHLFNNVARRPRALLVALVAAAAVALSASAVGCGLFDALGNAWCMPMGAGGASSVNGVGGAGGAGSGGGGGSGDVSVGAGGSGSSDVSAGAGAGGGEARRPWPAHRFNPYVWPSQPTGSRHRHRPERVGTARQADCPPPPTMMAPAPPMKIPLTTTRLRAIAAAQGIGAGMTGIQLNREVGLAFENWALYVLNLLPRWNKPIESPERKNRNKGLPASVIPEQVTDLKLIADNAMGPLVFPESRFWEMKAVNGNLLPSTSKWQILGLIDVATLSAAGMSNVLHHPPPQVIFTITGNTIVTDAVYSQATQVGVAIWVQVAFEEPTSPDDPNPLLYIGTMYPMNQDVYGKAIPVPVPPSGIGRTLTSPPTPPVVVPGDPDPPEVD